MAMKPHSIMWNTLYPILQCIPKPASHERIPVCNLDTTGLLLLSPLCPGASRRGDWNDYTSCQILSFRITKMPNSHIGSMTRICMWVIIYTFITSLFNFGLPIVFV